MAYEPKPEEKSMGMLSHLLCIFTTWLGPLIIFLIKKEESPYVKLHAKQALVWGVAMAILLIVSSVTMVIFIGCILYPATLVLHLVFTIMGTIKVNKGEKFLYPIVSGMFCKDEIAAVYGDGGPAAGQAPPPPPAAPGA